MQLRVIDVSKSYGDNQVLSAVSLQIDAGRRVGLVGANGVGKSTLLRMIVGGESPDGGRILLAPDLEIGYLPQALATADALTVDQVIERALKEVTTLRERMRALEEAMAVQGSDTDRLLAEYGAVSERFDARGGYRLTHARDEVFAGLGLARIDGGRPVATLSGGERSRVGLAAVLLATPDLLLLDEPTNHLDFDALEWLESYLTGFQGGVLAVSHDRDFLNHAVTEIVEIDEQSRGSRHYAGAYDFYAEQLQVHRQRWEADYGAQQEEIKQLQRFIRGRARQVAHNRPPRDGEKFAYTHKGERVQDAVSRNVRAAEEKLRRIEADPVPRPPQPIAINPDFDPAALFNRTPVAATGLVKRYGARLLLPGVDCSIGAGDRIVLVGPNGIGKSTLLRILAGLDQPDAGEVQRAAGVIVGYLDQEQLLPDEDLTVLEAYRAGRAGDPEQIKAELMGYHLFTYPELARRVGHLSIGQKRKLQIAGLIAARANVLLLDEPTNHISLDVLDEFEKALADFAGPILAVSHDRHFNRRFANQVWELDVRGVHRFLGTWDEWRAREKRPQKAIQP